MIIEVISLLLAIIYVPVSLYLKKEPNLKFFIIVFISSAYILKSLLTIYSVIVLNQNTDFLVYIIIGAASIVWVSYEKIQHVLKNDI